MGIDLVAVVVGPGAGGLTGSGGLATPDDLSGSSTSTTRTSGRCLFIKFPSSLVSAVAQRLQ